MYQSSYAAIAEDDCGLARANEYRAMDRAISLLEAARQNGPASRESIEAVAYVNRLWGLLIDDLASSANSLPEALRAQLISIGLWSMKEAEAIRLGQSDDYDSMIDVSRMIRDSLA